MKGFVDAQVDHCLSICMFCGRVLIRKSNPLHEPSPGTVYRGSPNSFCKQLQKDHSSLIHHKSLAIELHSVKKTLSSEKMNSIFLTRILKYKMN